MDNKLTYNAATWEMIDEAVAKSNDEVFKEMQAGRIVKALIWKVSELDTELRVLKNLQDAYEKKLYVQCLTDDRIKEYKEKLKRENGTS